MSIHPPRQQRVCTKCGSVFDPVKSSATARDRLRVCQACRSAAQSVNKARYVKKHRTEQGMTTKAKGRGPTWDDRDLGQDVAVHLALAWAQPGAVSLRAIETLQESA